MKSQIFFEYQIMEIRDGNKNLLCHLSPRLVYLLPVGRRLDEPSIEFL